MNHYVHDSELDAYLAGADAVCLPYLRSSISGPLHVAMSYGVPVIITPVGGNAEASEHYSGIHLVPVHDPDAIATEIRTLRPGARERHENPASWEASARAYRALADRLAGRRGEPRRAAGSRVQANLGRAAPCRRRGARGMSSFAVIVPRATTPGTGVLSDIRERGAAVWRTATAETRLGLIPIVSLVGALGLVIVALADTLSRLVIPGG